MAKEIWKDIIGYEGKYKISSEGRVKSMDYSRQGIKKILLGGIGTLGHTRFSFCLKGIKFNISCHRLVAIYFIPNPNNLPLVCHKDETLDLKGALYNGMDNLFWGTHKDNIRDKHNKGRANNHFQLNHPNKGKFGKDNIRSKKVNQYSLDGEFIKEWDSLKIIKDELGINSSNISICCYGKNGRKSAGGFIWKFK